MVAYHELGHALVALTLPGVDPVHKVSIIPRGVGALGYTLQRPIEDRFLMTVEELENKMTVLLGGRAAEQLVFGEISTGAADDLLKVTEIARSMVTRYGMDPALGQATLETERGTFLGQPIEGGGRRFTRTPRARSTSRCASASSGPTRRRSRSCARARAASWRAWPRNSWRRRR